MDWEEEIQEIVQELEELEHILNIKSMSKKIKLIMILVNSIEALISERMQIVSYQNINSLMMMNLSLLIVLCMENKLLKEINLKN